MAGDSRNSTPASPPTKRRTSGAFPATSLPRFEISSLRATRDDLLRRLPARSARARTQRGQRQVVFVSGTAGAGKTALLDHFLDEIRADGGVGCARGQALELQGRDQGCTAVLDLLSRLCDEAGGDEVVQSLARR